MIKTTQTIGDIMVHQLKQNYIRLENSSQYIEDIQCIDPYDEERYASYWRGIKKKVIEGMWGVESGGYRYCTSNLYFYANFGLIESTDEAKITTYIRPLIQDLEWEFSYEYLEAKGFSGFYEDDEVTCDTLVLSYDIDKLPITKREKQLFSSNGDLKRYEHANSYIRRLHEYPKGPPLFYNQARNINIGGSRGRQNPLPSLQVIVE